MCCGSVLGVAGAKIAKSLVNCHWYIHLLYTKRIKKAEDKREKTGHPNLAESWFDFPSSCSQAVQLPKDLPGRVPPLPWISRPSTEVICKSGRIGTGIRRPQVVDSCGFPMRSRYCWPGRVPCWSGISG